MTLPAVLLLALVFLVSVWVLVRQRDPRREDQRRLEGLGIAKGHQRKTRFG